MPLPLALLINSYALIAAGQQAAQFAWTQELRLCSYLNSGPFWILARLLSLKSGLMTNADGGVIPAPFLACIACIHSELLGVQSNNNNNNSSMIDNYINSNDNSNSEKNIENCFPVHDELGMCGTSLVSPKLLVHKPFSNLLDEQDDW